MTTFRAVTAALLVLAALSPVPRVSADPVQTQRVDCAKGQSINQALDRDDERKPLLVVIRGPCTESVVGGRDDVPPRGEPGAAIVAADPSQPPLTLDGARRVLVTGLTLGGGSDGVFAVRGSTVDVAACALQNNSRFGLVVSFGGTAVVDNCLIQTNGGGGAVATNGAQLVVTNSTVQNNTGNGLTAARNAHLRVGQDAAGSMTPWPVTVRGNTQGGIVVTDASAGIVVATTVENNGGSGVVSQASGTVIGSQVRGNGRYGVASLNSGSARLGITDAGTGTPTSGNTIENNTLEGVHLVGASSAWMFGNTIQGNSTTNGRFGILAVEGSAV